MKSIILSTHEIASLLSGRQIDLWLVVKPQPPRFVGPHKIDPWEEGITAFKPDQFGLYVEGLLSGRWGLRQILTCPFVSGCKLVCRETFAAYTGGMTGDGEEFDIAEGPLEPDMHTYSIVYKADDAENRSRWRSASQMPVWASRLSIQVDSVRCQRNTGGLWCWVVSARKYTK